VTVHAGAAPLARVDLARDARTTLVLPAALVLLGVAVAGVSVVLGWPVLLIGGAIGVLLAGAGAWIALRTRSLRLSVETDYLHLTGRRLDRRYHLARGRLSRVATAGPNSVQLRTRPSTLGLGMGATTLGSGEQIEVIRLGATPSVILVPTERGRVAVAAASETALVEALMSAARTRAERPSVPAPARVPAGGPAAAAALAPVATAVATTATTPASAVTARPPVVTPSAPPPGPVVTPSVPPPGPVERPSPPRPLTGIERMWLEEKMASERRAAMTGARSEQAAANLASVAALTPGSRSAPTAAQAISTPWRAAPSPAAASVPVAAAAATASVAATIAAPAAPVATTATAAEAPVRAVLSSIPRALPRALPRRRPLRPMAWREARPTLATELALFGAPLVGAGVVWFLAAVVGTAPGTAGLDPIGAALLLCGPIAVLAVFLARGRWPRLAGLSSVAAVIALALVARAVIG
jgi:hypothetical protein